MTLLREHLGNIPLDAFTKSEAKIAVKLCCNAVRWFLAEVIQRRVVWQKLMEPHRDSLSEAAMLNFWMRKKGIIVTN